MSRTEQSERRRVVVTAMGVVSPLGNGIAATTASLREGRDCVTAITSFDVSKCRSKTAGQSDAMLLEHRGTRLDRLHPASLMMIAATRELAIADQAFAPQLAIIGTTSGGMSFGQDFYRAQIEKRSSPQRAAWLANYMPQKAVLDALRDSNWSCPSQIIANACASGTNAVGHAFHLVRAGEFDRVLCGGYDAISEMVFVGFDSLQASTPEKVRPFDKARTGLVLGEGAAVLALEEMEAAKRRGAHILAEVTGYGISTDNHHLTQPHPSGVGPRLAMERALADARRVPADVHYINAHGTATTFNDATEGLAIAQVFGERAVPVSSTKSMMGHALGGAGAIECVFSLIALREQFLPPNINFETLDPVLPIDVVANASREARVHCVMSNSFGFGGTNASIVMEAA